MKIKLILGLFCLAVCTAATSAKAQFMTGETVPQSQSVLDSYFVTNAVPGQQQYWEWIDTMFYYIMATYTNSQAAAQAAANSQAVNQRVFASLYVSVGLSASTQQAWTFYATNGFSSNSVTIGTFNPSGTTLYYIWMTNWFAVPRTNLATTPFSGPVWFTCTVPPPAGGVLTNSISTAGQPYLLPPANIPPGANVNILPFTGLNSLTVDGYTLTTNYFAFFVNLGSSSAVGTNNFFFTFFQ